MFELLGIKSPKANFTRGVYFCELYKNTKEFLRMETTDLGDKKFDNSVEALTSLWKERYAKKRLENLFKSDRYSTEPLYYDDLIGLSWEETKTRYLKDIGR